MSDLFGVGGQELLAAARLRVESRSRIDSLLRVITAPQARLLLVWFSLYEDGGRDKRANPMFFLGRVVGRGHVAAPGTMWMPITGNGDAPSKSYPA